MENLRLNALALHLGVDVEELNVSSYDDNVIEYGSEEYLVVTDDEADELWEQELDNLLEEIVYPELPKHLRNYFDDEKWKRDARYDGRAHSLSHYDGNEDEITVYYFDTIDGDIYQDCEGYDNSEGYEEVSSEKETFYIYRQN